MKKRTTKKTVAAKKTVAKKPVAKKPAARPSAAAHTRRPTTSVATKAPPKTRPEAGNGRAQGASRPPELPATAGWPPFRYPPE